MGRGVGGALIELPCLVWRHGHETTPPGVVEETVKYTTGSLGSAAVLVNPVITVGNFGDYEFLPARRQVTLHH